MQASLFDPIPAPPAPKPEPRLAGVAEHLDLQERAKAHVRRDAYGQTTPERAQMCRRLAHVVMQGSATSPALRDSYLAEADAIEREIRPDDDYELEYATVEEATRYRDEAYRELVRCRAEGRDDRDALQKLAARQADLAAATRRGR